MKLTIGVFGEYVSGDHPNVEVITDTCARGRLKALKDILKKCTTEYILVVNEGDAVKTPSEGDVEFNTDVVFPKYFGINQESVYMDIERDVTFCKEDFDILNAPLNAKIIKTDILREALKNTSNVVINNLDTFITILSMKYIHNISNVRDIAVYENKNKSYYRKNLPLTDYVQFIKGSTEMSIEVNKNLTEDELEILGQRDFYNQTIFLYLNIIWERCSEKYNSLEGLVCSKVNSLLLIKLVDDMFIDFDNKERILKSVIKIMTDKNLGFMRDSVEILC